MRCEVRIVLQNDFYRPSALRSLQRSCPLSAMTTGTRVVPLSLPTCSIAETTSWPEMTLPKTVCLPSNQDASAKQRKNWLELVSGWWMGFKGEIKKVVISERYIIFHSTYRTGAATSQDAPRQLSNNTHSSIRHTQDSRACVLQPRKRRKFVLSFEWMPWGGFDVHARELVVVRRTYLKFSSGNLFP